MDLKVDLSEYLTSELFVSSFDESRQLLVVSGKMSDSGVAEPCKPPQSIYHLIDNRVRRVDVALPTFINAAKARYLERCSLVHDTDQAF